jgi:haloalkane dehalogenase
MTQTQNAQVGPTDPNERIAKRKVLLEGAQLAYVDRGQGPVVVFLHGNPSSSYLWRHLIAVLDERHRCLAPDLVGMGDSDKLPAGDLYDYATHQRFVDAWFDAVVPDEPVILVVHDWGSALGLDWASRHPERVRGVVYMEAILGALSWAAMPPQGRAFFEALRGPAGEEMVLAHNAFVEMVLAPGGFLRPPAEEDAAEYRRPFLAPGEGRRPTLSWPRLLPFDGQPAEIAERVERYVAWFSASPVPKLFVEADPGRILVGALRERCRAFPHQTRVTVPGLHYPQEDSPREVASAVIAWIASLPA